MLLKISKIRDVVVPSRAHSTDAGIDFKMPKFTESFKNDLLAKEANLKIFFDDNGKLVVPPGENALIPSGIKLEIPYGYMGLFLNKSGMSSKKDVVIGAQVIDCGYDGEVHIDIHNIGNDFLYLEENQGLAQMVLVPILTCDVTQCDEEDLYDWMKKDHLSRGDKGFGSTEKK